MSRGLEEIGERVATVVEVCERPEVEEEVLERLEVEHREGSSAGRLVPFNSSETRQAVAKNLHR